jgi:hypothetical protein
MRDALVESKKQYWQEQEHEYCCQLHWEYGWCKCYPLVPTQ